MDEKVLEKLKVLAESAKYDVSCASSGTSRKNKSGGIGSAAGHNTGTQEKPFDIVTAVKFDCEVHQFRHRQCGTGNIVAAAIDAVGAIEHAVIYQHDLQQKNPLSLYHYEGCSY